MEFRTFQAISASGVILAAALIILYFPLLFVRLVPGLALLWGEIAVGLIANRVAFTLTKRGVALEGIKGEQNPVMRSMLATGNFTGLYMVYATMLGAGAVITAFSVYIGAVSFRTLILMVAFPLLLAADMLNDYLVVGRLERAASVGAAAL